MKPPTEREALWFMAGAILSLTYAALLRLVFPND